MPRPLTVLCFVSSGSLIHNFLSTPPTLNLQPSMLDRPQQTNLCTHVLESATLDAERENNVDATACLEQQGSFCMC